jgi:hypothetical protein
MSSIVNFGKHRGETLVEIVFSDPAWFRWATINKVFFDRGGRPLQAEAEEIWHKGRNIKLPEDDPENWQAAYFYVGRKQKFVDVWVVPKREPQQDAELKPVLDLGHVCAFERDGRGNKLFGK